MRAPFYTCPQFNKLEDFYFAGLIASDGNVSRGKNRVALSLHKKDLKHLIKFKKWLKSTYKISKDRDNYVVRVGKAQELTSFLRLLNITPKKSLTLKPPQLMGDKALAFICGLIDGDGSIFRRSTGYLSVNLTGTKPICEWVKTHIHGMGKAVLDKRASGKTYQIQTSHRGNIEQLYRDVKLLKLPLLARKWGKLEKTFK